MIALAVAPLHAHAFPATLLPRAARAGRPPALRPVQPAPRGLHGVLRRMGDQVGPALLDRAEARKVLQQLAQIEVYEGHFRAVVLKYPDVSASSGLAQAVAEYDSAASRLAEPLERIRQTAAKVFREGGTASLLPGDRAMLDDVEDSAGAVISKTWEVLRGMGKDIHSERPRMRTPEEMAGGGPAPGPSPGAVGGAAGEAPAGLVVGLFALAGAVLVGGALVAFA